MSIYDLGVSGTTVDPSIGNAGAGLPEPGARKPSLLARVAARLSPINPEYAAVLTPDEQAALRGRNIRTLGINLLQAGGPRPQGTANFLSRVGEALGGVHADEAARQAAQDAIALHTQQDQARQQEALQSILAANPAQPNETPAQTMQRLANVESQLLQGGFVELASKLGTMRKQFESPTGLHEIKSPDGTHVDLVDNAGNTVRTITYSPKEAHEPDQTRQWRTNLATEFTQQTAAEHVVARNYADLVSLAAQPQSAARDQALLTKYYQLITPNITMGAANAAGPGEHIGGLPGEIANLWSAVFNGQKKLGQPEVDTLLRNAQPIAQNAYRTYASTARTYVGIGSRHGVDPRDIADFSIWKGTGLTAPSVEQNIITEGDCIIDPSTCQR